MRACVVSGTFAAALVALVLCACGSSDDNTGTDTGGFGATGVGAGGGQGTTGGHDATGGAQGGSGASSGGTGGGVWRPFSDDSPWNTLIAESPELEADSEALIEDLKTSSPYGPFVSVNIDGYSIPLYEADGASPQLQVHCDIGGMGFTSNNGNDAVALLPMPADAAPDPQSDHHMLVVDRAANLEWGFWDTVNTAGAWTCGVGANIDLTGTGVRPPPDGSQPWYVSVGARACGFPLIAGLIRVVEVEAGAIEHALVIAYPHIRSVYLTPPASTAQGTVGNDAISTRGIPCGGRIQLDPTLDVTSLGVSPAYVAILRALQRYGAYVGDFSGAISLYAENSPEAQAYWASGVLGSYDLDGVLDISRFRALKQGTMYQYGN